MFLIHDLLMTVILVPQDFSISAHKCPSSLVHKQSLVQHRHSGGTEVKDLGSIRLLGLVEMGPPDNPCVAIVCLTRASIVCPTALCCMLPPFTHSVSFSFKVAEIICLIKAPLIHCFYHLLPYCLSKLDASKGPCAVYMISRAHHHHHPHPPTWNSFSAGSHFLLLTEQM